MAKWRSMSNHSALTPSVSFTMWPCVCSLPCFIFLSLFFHSSVTMTAGWEGGFAVVTVNWELNWKSGVWRADFMSSKCKRSEDICGYRQPWATHFASQRTQKELWLTAIEKCITLKLCQAMCLHHLNSQTYTDRHLLYCATSNSAVCYNPGIWLLTIFLW